MVSLCRKHYSDIIDTIESYDEIASSYRGLRRRPWKIASLARGKVILDLGSGHCINGVYAARARNSYILCLDASFRMALYASREVSRANVIGDCIVGDLTKLPLRDGSVDSIIAIASLHHLPKPMLLYALSEGSRVLRLSGLMISAIWSWRQARFLIQTFLNILASIFGVLSIRWRYIVYWRTRRGRYPRIYYLYPLKVLQPMFSGSGFRILGSGYTGYLRNESTNIYIVAAKNPRGS